MRRCTNLWSVIQDCPCDFIEEVSELLGQNAVAISVLTPPRKSYAQVHVLFNEHPDLPGLMARMAIFSALHSINLPTLLLKESPSLDWLKKVSSDFPPIKIARWTIHGALHRHKVPRRLWSLQIDATNAFGTGEHPTTAGCLQMISMLLKKGISLRRILDMGCGSGILAMAAVQGGRSQGKIERAVAVDLDRDSVQIAVENTKVNGLKSSIMIAQSNGYTHPLVRCPQGYTLIMANIFARPLSTMARDVKKSLQPGGYAILSGLLTSQANLVISAYKRHGLSLVHHHKLGEWSVLALRLGHGAI